MERAPLTEHLKQTARRLGFALVGVSPAIEADGYVRLREWLAAGYAGEMHYFASREEAYRHPAGVLPGVRSLLVLGMPYRTGEPTPASAGEGRISRYAWGESDYHDLIRDRLHKLVEELRRLAPDSHARGVVDTAPLLEREFARWAGLGWIGKHTLLLNQSGSWFFLAALLTDLELEYDQPFSAEHCGSCTACLDSCPTDAFPQPYLLDARKCISYLTIELQEPIPEQLRPGLGEWVFGCDVCQEVCPWNRRSPRGEEDFFSPRVEHNPVDLLDLLALTEASFRVRYRNTPLWRARRRGMVRNAAIALGNRPTRRAVEPLLQLLDDVEPLIRGAAAWALARHEDVRIETALRARAAVEEEPVVQDELAAALAYLTATA